MLKMFQNGTHLNPDIKLTAPPPASGHDEKCDSNFSKSGTRFASLVAFFNTNSNLFEFKVDFVIGGHSKKYSSKSVPFFKMFMKSSRKSWLVLKF